MVDTINAQNYYDAATALFGVAAAIVRANDAAFAELSGTERMAGKDNKGKEFSQAYDRQFNEIRQHAYTLARAIHNYGSVVRQMGINHADAETQSNINGATPPQPPAEPSLNIAYGPYAVASSGGDSDGLMDNIFLLEKIGIPVPSGNTDKLSKAEAAWNKLASDPGGQYSGKISALTSKFDDLNGDEIDFVINDLEELDSSVQDYIGAANDLKEACAQHREYLQGLRNDLKNLLTDLAKELAVDAAIAIAASLVSFGVGALVTTGKVAATIAKFAKLIKNAILVVEKTKYGKPVVELLTFSKKDRDLLRFLRMEKKAAKTRGAKNNVNGRIGEIKAGIDPKAPKTEIRINNRTRIPDKVDEFTHELTEVKNTNSIGKTRQIQDMAEWAQQNGYTMKLVVDTRTQISAPLQEYIKSHNIELVVKVLN